MKKRHIAIMGGTFDPIHNGHLHVIDAVIKNVVMDEFWLLPNAIPPHRSLPMLDAQTRLALCKAATAPYSNVKVKDIELKLPPPSYTLNTLQFLHQSEPDASFLWVLGADAWQGFTRWHQWENVLPLANWLVLQRPGVPLIPDKGSALWDAWQQHQDIVTAKSWDEAGGRVYTLSLPTMHPASSTAIRKAWKNGTLEAVKEWMPSAVLNALHQAG